MSCLYESTYLEPGTFVRSHYRAQWYGIVIRCEESMYINTFLATVRATHHPDGRYYNGNRRFTLITRFLRIVSSEFINRDVVEEHVLNEHRLLIPVRN